MLPAFYFSLAIVNLLILGLAVILDLGLGDPSNNFHPTAWMGKLIAILKPKFKSENAQIEKLGGVILAVIPIFIFTSASFFMLYLLQTCTFMFIYLAAACVLLKLTFALRGMENHAKPIFEAAENGDLQEARRAVSLIVRRDPERLTDSQVLSAAVESVSEGTVDGITSPIFYYAILGVPAAVAYRVINTLDSMVAYKDKEHIYLGWFSAKLDTAANYIPARITGFLMVVAARILRENWREALRILKRDRQSLESLNAGWPMSAIAGALNVRLEKPGSYILGDNNVTLQPTHIIRALRIVKLTSYLFIMLIAIPIILLTSLLWG